MAEFVTPPPASAKRRSDGKGRGNRRQPNSKRQRNLSLQADNRARKLAVLCAPENCVWETSNRGGLQQWNNDHMHSDACCGKECMATYFPEGHTDTREMVGSLRKYYKTKLDKQSRREFQCQRVLFRGYDFDLGETCVERSYSSTTSRTLHYCGTDCAAWRMAPAMDCHHQTHMGHDLCA